MPYFEYSTNQIHFPYISPTPGVGEKWRGLNFRFAPFLTPLWWPKELRTLTDFHLCNRPISRLSRFVVDRQRPKSPGPDGFLRAVGGGRRHAYDFNRYGLFRNMPRHLVLSFTERNTRGSYEQSSYHEKTKNENKNNSFFHATLLPLWIENIISVLIIHSSKQNTHKSLFPLHLV